MSMEEKLLDYLKARDEQRLNEVETFLNSLTKKQRQLVKEAAVMGYVQGVQAERARVESIPPDSEIVHRVVAACQSFSDLYPRIGDKK